MARNTAIARARAAAPARPDSSIEIQMQRLVDAHESELRRYLRRRTSRALRAELEADDLMQEVRITVLMRSRTAHFRKPGNVPAWLRAIVRTRIADQQRRAEGLKRPQIAQRLPDSILDEVVGRALAPPDDAVRREWIARLIWVEWLLSREQSRAVVLHYYQNQSYDRMAEELHCTPRQARRCLEHALYWLRTFVLCHPGGPRRLAPEQCWSYLYSQD
jgi:RNA polymerase sigma factor (sigma-70 family)